MTDELVTSGDLSPWNRYFRWTRALAAKAIFLLTFHFIELDDVNQPTMSDRGFKALCEIRVFKAEPLSDGLVRVAVTKSADDLPVVAITPNCR